MVGTLMVWLRFDPDGEMDNQEDFQSCESE